MEINTLIHVTSENLTQKQNTVILTAWGLHQQPVHILYTQLVAEPLELIYVKKKNYEIKNLETTEKIYKTIYT